MNYSDIPSKFQHAWAALASSAYTRTVPDAPGSDANAASLQQGFPAATFASGGAPEGQDFNGILQALTSWARWQAAGSPVEYDSTYSGWIGGYPKGARLVSSKDPTRTWISTADGNTTDPDGSSPANWATDGIAPGALQYFYLSSAPAGWLKMDGSTYNTADYPALARALGASGSTFTLPDARGTFARALNTSGSGYDPSRTLAALQTDAFQGHHHTLPNVPIQGSGYGYSGTSGVTGTPATETGAAITDGTNGTPRVASETRPVNYAWLFCIRY